MRSGWFKPVHANSDDADRTKLVLARRRTLKRKLLDTENEVNQDGPNSRRGDGEVRTAFYQAASSLLRQSRKACGLKAWGMKVTAKSGHKPAVMEVVTRWR